MRYPFVIPQRGRGGLGRKVDRTDQLACLDANEMAVSREESFVMPQSLRLALCQSGRHISASNDEDDSRTPLPPGAVADGQWPTAHLDEHLQKLNCCCATPSGV